MKDPLIIHAFMTGAIGMGFAAISLLFVDFWKRSSIRLFGAFAFAFALMAVERIVLVLVNVENEFASYVYLIRLTAFIVIILGIIDHNRTGKT